MNLFPICFSLLVDRIPFSHPYLSTGVCSVGFLAINLFTDVVTNSNSFLSGVRPMKIHLDNVLQFLNLEMTVLPLALGRKKKL